MNERKTKFRKELEGKKESKKEGRKKIISKGGANERSIDRKKEKGK